MTTSTVSLRSLSDEDLSSGILPGFPPVAEAKLKFPDLLAIEANGQFAGVLAKDLNNEVAVHVLEHLHRRGIARDACLQYFDMCRLRGDKQLTAAAIPGKAGYAFLQSLGAKSVGKRTFENGRFVEEVFEISLV